MNLLKPQKDIIITLTEAEECFSFLLSRLSAVSEPTKSCCAAHHIKGVPRNWAQLRLIVDSQEVKVRYESEEKARVDYKKLMSLWSEEGLPA